MKTADSHSEGGPRQFRQWGARYELLDGLRGVAALLVVLDHLMVVTNEVGHLAVMVFFVISGYCISAAADRCWKSGLGLREYMRRRIRRIYPPYLCAIAFFAITRLVKWQTGGPNDLHRSPIEWLQNLTLTQWLSDVGHPVAMPAQNATLFVPAFWSLNYEEQFYLVVGLLFLLGTRWRRATFWLALTSGLLGLGWNFIRPGNWICGFFLEYWAHFCLGGLLYFYLTGAPQSAVRRAFIPVLCTLAVVCGLRLLPGMPFESMRAMYELAFLSAATFSLLLLRPYSEYLGAHPLWRPVSLLGTISYSLYLIHTFNLNLVAAVARHITHASDTSALFVLVKVALHIVLAWAFWSVCERPFLKRPSKTALDVPRLSASTGAA